MTNFVELWMELWGFDSQTSCMPYDFTDGPGGSGRVPVVTSPARKCDPRVWLGLAVYREWPTDWPTLVGSKRVPLHDSAPTLEARGADLTTRRRVRAIASLRFR